MPVTVELDDDAQQVLQRLAEAEGVTEAEVARRAILERAERRARQEVAEAGTRAVTRYADLLDRLAQ